MSVPLGGLVILDKPAGLTSHDVVSRVRRLAGTRRVGHAGTLDPMATGVLVLGIERCTRLLTHVVGVDKAYTATVRLGQATLTDDAEGEVIAAVGAHGLDLARVEAAIAPLRGDIEQAPSAVSAIKVNGQRSYARVRAGEDVELPARPVRVAEFAALGTRNAQAPDGTLVVDLDVRVECSSGTYIRALARDLGAGLGVGGHLTALRRTRVGPFADSDAQPLPEPGGDLAVMDASVALERLFSVRVLDVEEARAVRHGRSIPATGTAGPVGALDVDGGALGVLTDDPETALARPVLVLAPA